MPSERDKTSKKRWQFGLREIVYVMTLLCAVFATMPLGLGLFLLIAPLYFVMFLSIVGKPDLAVLLLMFWMPFGALATFAIMFFPPPT